MQTLVHAFAMTVSRFVRFQMCNCKKELGAVGALVSLFADVQHLVLLHACQGREPFAADGTNVRRVRHLVVMLQA